MKRSIITIFGIGILLYPLICFASYVIHLKDGREFATEQYYEEGGQIKFKRFGGIIGIQKDLVREIEEIEDVEELPAEKKKAEPVREDVSQSTKKQEAEAGGTVEEGKEEVPGKIAKEQEKEKPAEVSEADKKKSEQEKASKMQAFLEEKRQIIAERDRICSAFKEAKASKDRERKNQYWNELLSLQKKLGKLREQVMAEHGGKLPPWWDSAI